jgi:hypothetical protein
MPEGVTLRHQIIEHKHKHCTHTEEANEPRPGKDLGIYIKIHGKRKTGCVDKDIRGLFTRLRKRKVGHWLEANVLP